MTFEPVWAVGNLDMGAVLIGLGLGGFLVFVILWDFALKHPQKLHRVRMNRIKELQESIDLLKKADEWRADQQ